MEWATEQFWRLVSEHTTNHFHGIWNYRGSHMTCMYELFLSQNGLTKSWYEFGDSRYGLLSTGACSC